MLSLSARVTSRYCFVYETRWSLWASQRTRGLVLQIDVFRQQRWHIARLSTFVLPTDNRPARASVWLRSSIEFITHLIRFNPFSDCNRNDVDEWLNFLAKTLVICTHWSVLTCRPNLYVARCLASLIDVTQWSEVDDFLNLFHCAVHCVSSISLGLHIVVFKVARSKM